MSALFKHENTQIASSFTTDQRQVIKDVFCKGLTYDEIKVFEFTCERTGLCPFSKQIHPVKRNDKKLGREVMTIQTSIDGFRLIADRTGRYCPGREPTFQYDKNGSVLSATAYIKKQTKDGTWHEVSATAFFSEYAQGFKDFNTGLKKLTPFWLDMPHNQLAKCAESLCIRKAFPADLSGIYSHDEMAQSEVIDVVTQPSHKLNPNVIEMVKPIEYITQEQIEELTKIISECDPKVKPNIDRLILQKCSGEGLEKLKIQCYPDFRNLLLDRRSRYQAKLMEMKMNGEEVEDADS